MLNEQKEKIVPVHLSTNDAYKSFLRTKLKRSLNDIQNNRVMTIEESQKRLQEKYANFTIN